MKWTVVFVLTFFTMPLLGQESLTPTELTRIGEVLPPSPNAASLGKFGGIPVNMSSGRASVSIPLLEMKTPNISLPVTLKYSTSGFKVDDAGSRVGQDWTFNIGGVITRTVMDSPDEISTHPTVPSDFSQGLDNLTVYNFLNLVNQASTDYVDLQPDIFSYNFGSYQGRFIISGSSVIMLPHSNLDIRTSLIETYLIEGCHFKITTPDGIAYYFGGDAYENSASESFGFNCGTYKDFDLQATAWYLKKIVHPDGDWIEFYYSGGVNLDYKASIHESRTRKIMNSEYYYCPEEGPALPGDVNSTCITRLMHIGVRLDSIETSSGQKVKINYRSRDDLPGDFLVQDISLYEFNSNVRWKYFELDYEDVLCNSYTNSWNQNEEDLKKRYFLKSITEKSESGTIGQQYLLGYTDLTGLPARLSFARDYWGYFNGKGNSTLLYVTDPAVNSIPLINPFFASADRSPDPSYSKKGLLNKIIYPTGGWDSIIYEGHTCKVTEQQATVEDFDVNVNGASYSNGSPTVVESAQFTPLQQQTVNMRVTCAYFGEGGFEPEFDKVRYSVLNVTDNLYLINDATLYAGDGVVNEVTVPVGFLAGKTYKIILEIYGMEVSARATLVYTSTVYTDVTINKPVGGVRVAKILTKDPIADKVSIKKYLYSFLNDLNYSSCDNVQFNFDNLTISRVELPCPNDIGCGFNKANYYTLSTSTYYNISPFGGSNISYKSVVESLGENFENGGIEHLFSSVRDIAPVRNYGALPIRSPFTNMEWAHALQTYKRDFAYVSGSYITKREENVVYKTDLRVLDDYSAYTIRKNHTKKCYTTGDILIVDSYGVPPFDACEYKVQQRWRYPDTVTIKTYSYPGNSEFISQVFTYEHERTSNLKPTMASTITSAGQPITQKTTYAGDLFESNQPAWLNNLQTHGFSEAIIEQLTIKTIDGTDYVVGGLLTIYDEDFLKPVTVYKLEISEPVQVLQFNACSINNGSFTFDSRYKIESQFHYSDINGNLIQQANLEEDMFISYVWDYKNSFPVAQITNSPVQDIAYTSFEADGKGGWNFSGNASSDNTAPTGKKIYSLTNGAISKSDLNNSETYIVSYWSKSGSQNVDATVATGGQIMGNWQYWEHKIPNPGGGTITISGSGEIDELKLYPANARMVTYTYEPHLGMSSKCDANNRILYYEYDDLGRLKHIFDQDKNILEKFEYKYQ